MLIGSIFRNPSESKGFNKYKLEDHVNSMKSVKEPGWELVSSLNLWWVILNSISIFRIALLRPKSEIQQEAACLAIIDLLWKVKPGSSVWTNSKFWPNRIPEYYSYAMFDRIEYTNNSDLIIRIIRIIRNTFERLKLGQIMPKKACNS